MAGLTYERLCRFRSDPGAEPRIGAVSSGERVVDLTHVGVSSLADVLDREDPAAHLRLLRGSETARPSRRWSCCRLWSTTKSGPPA